ncbi:Uncharacterized protein TCM_041337, partial [Theobroma cacao]
VEREKPDTFFRPPSLPFPPFFPLCVACALSLCHIKSAGRERREQSKPSFIIVYYIRTPQQRLFLFFLCFLCSFFRERERFEGCTKIAEDFRLSTYFFHNDLLA